MLLLGMKARTPPSLPCAISVPNLIADRAPLLARTRRSLNVRRLMYQPLIWVVQVGDEARRLGSALDAKDLKRLTNSLINGVRGDPELDRDLL